MVKTVKLRFQKKVKTAETQWYQRFSMARWKGLEPLTYWFVGATKTYQPFHTTTYSAFYPVTLTKTQENSQ